MSSERFLTLVEVADELNISTSQAYALVRSGDLVGIQIGGRNQWRVERIKLEQFVAIQLGARAGGSHGPVVNSSVSASSLSLPHLVAVDR